MKIAVFTTSDIQSHASNVRCYVKKPLHTSQVDFGGKVHEYASWGVLEKALEQGYHVYVVTTRTFFSTHDDWWLELVAEQPKKSGFPLPEKSIDSRCICYGNVVLAGPCLGLNDEYTMQDWRDFIRDRLGLEPNPEARTWLDLQEGLIRHDIKLGRHFQIRS